MRVKLERSIGNRRGFTEGSTVDIDRPTGELWIAKGLAVLVEADEAPEPQPEPEAEPEEMPEPIEEDDEPIVAFDPDEEPESEEDEAEEETPQPGRRRRRKRNQ